MFSNHNFVIISDSPISTLKRAKLNPCSVQVTQCPQWTKQIAELPKKTDKKTESWWLFAMLRYASGCTLYRWHSSVVGTNCFLFGRMRTHIFHRAPIIIFIASQSVFFPVIQSTLKGSEKILSTK